MLLFTGPTPNSPRSLNVAIVNPVSVMSMPATGGESLAHWLDLSALFPMARGLWTPQLNLAPLSRGGVLLHEGIVCEIILYATTTL